MSEEFYGKNLFNETVNFGFDEAEEESEISTKKQGEFNIFLLTDAISARDKRNAWVIYEKALASGMAAEEIFWRVAWAVKSMLLTSKTKSAEEAGLNPFVHRKAKSFLKNWKEKELEMLSESLVTGFHDARRGITEIEILLEKIILSL